MLQFNTDLEVNPPEVESAENQRLYSTRIDVRTDSPFYPVNCTCHVVKRDFHMTCKVETGKESTHRPTIDKSK